MLLNGDTIAAMRNGMADVLPTAIGNLWVEACYGGTIGFNGMFIWQNFALLPYSAIGNTAQYLIMCSIIQGLISWAGGE